MRIGAERYLSSSLTPNDRVADFYLGKMLADFTDDPTRARGSCGKSLRWVRVPGRRSWIARACRIIRRCELIRIFGGAARRCVDLAWDEMAQCKIPAGATQSAEANTSGGSKSGGKSGTKENANAAFDRDINVAQILNLARSIVQQNQILVRDNLQQIDRLVQRLSQMPGRRNMILVSPGFLSQTEQLQLDRVIDRALKSQVVIDSLDPRGLAILVRSGDSSPDTVLERRRDAGEPRCGLESRKCGDRRPGGSGGRDRRQICA